MGRKSQPCVRKQFCLGLNFLLFFLSSLSSPTPLDSHSKNACIVNNLGRCSQCLSSDRMAGLCTIKNKDNDVFHLKRWACLSCIVTFYIFMSWLFFSWNLIWWERRCKQDACTTLVECGCGQSAPPWLLYSLWEIRVRFPNLRDILFSSTTGRQWLTC